MMSFKVYLCFTKNRTPKLNPLVFADVSIMICIHSSMNSDRTRNSGLQKNWLYVFEITMIFVMTPKLRVVWFWNVGFLISSLSRLPNSYCSLRITRSTCVRSTWQLFIIRGVVRSLLWLVIRRTNQCSASGQRCVHWHVMACSMQHAMTWHGMS